jgi:hypothetical protein
MPAFYQNNMLHLTSVFYHKKLFEVWRNDAVTSVQLKLEYVVCHIFLFREECLCSCNAL